MRDGVLVSPPNGQRSSAGITLDGTLDVRRIKFFGTWRGGGQRRALNEFNKAPGKNGIALFTSDYGTSTPRISGSYCGGSLRLSRLDSQHRHRFHGGEHLAERVGGDRTGNGRARRPRDRGDEAPGGGAGRHAPWRSGSSSSRGGTRSATRSAAAPCSSAAGRPVYRANEAFETSLLAPRHPRTAIGQTADGRILLVAVDGRQSGYSVGMTTFEMAQTLVRLGAVRGMQLDGGGSTTLAFDGKILNRPSDKSERPISNALMLFYYGVYAPAAARIRLSLRTETASRRSRRSRSRSCDRRTSPSRSRRRTAPSRFRRPPRARRAPTRCRSRPRRRPAPPPDPSLPPPPAPGAASAGRGPLDAQRELRRRPGSHARRRSAASP